MTAPVNALVNPFIAGDTVTIPAGFEAQMTGPDRGFTFVVPKEATATVLDVTPARQIRYHNGRRALFLPTVIFGLKDKEYEAEITVDLLQANNIDAKIMIFV